MDYYLKFESKEVADAALFNEDGTQKVEATYDVIGEWATIDSTDPENPIVTKVDGYFVNIRGVGGLEFPTATVETPVTPWRVFA